MRNILYCFWEGKNLLNYQLKKKLRFDKNLFVLSNDNI